MCISLREARRAWKNAGGSVEVIPGAGEERYLHPALEHPITVNRRRKDAPRKLLVALRRRRAGSREPQCTITHGRGAAANRCSSAGTRDTR